MTKGIDQLARRLADEALYRPPPGGPPSYVTNTGGDVAVSTGTVDNSTNNAVWTQPNPARVLLPGAGLTLSLQASRGALISGGVVTAWVNQARPGNYFQASSTGATFSATGINGGPSINFTGGGSNGYADSAESINDASIDRYLFPTDWSVAGIVLFTSAHTWNPPVDPTTGLPLFGGLMHVGAFGNMMVAGGINPGNPAQVSFGGVQTPDGITFNFVQSAQVLKASPHTLVVTYDTAGMLNIWVDLLPVVSAGPFSPAALGSMQGDQALVGRNTLEGAWGGNIAEVDAWNRALTPFEVTTIVIPGLRARGLF